MTKPIVSSHPRIKFGRFSWHYDRTGNGGWQLGTPFMVIWRPYTLLGRLDRRTAHRVQSLVIPLLSGLAGGAAYCVVEQLWSLIWVYVAAELFVGKIYWSLLPSARKRESHDEMRTDVPQIRTWSLVPHAWFLVIGYERKITTAATPRPEDFTVDYVAVLRRSVIDRPPNRAAATYPDASRSKTVYTIDL